MCENEISQTAVHPYPLILRPFTKYHTTATHPSRFNPIILVHRLPHCKSSQIARPINPHKYKMFP